MHLVCIQAKNSIDFLKKVFSAYKSEKLFAIADCDNAQEFEHSRGIKASEFISTLSGGGWLEIGHLGSDAKSPAQVVFTSGTEGKPKAIVLSHGGLKNVVDRVNAAMELDSGVAEYIGVPVYHSFGLGRCRAVSAVGGKAFIPENGFDLQQVKQMLEKGEINALSAVPSLLRILLDNTALFEPVADKLKWIEIGSQFMSADEKYRLKNLFTEAKIVQHYGLTEASRTSLLRIDQAPDDLLESVGIVDSQMQLLTSDEGRLKIKGPHVALGLLNGDQVKPIVDQEGYFETSDLAEIKNGYLYFKGRADDVINCGGVKFDPANIEADLNRGYQVDEHIYLARIPDEYRGDGVLVSMLDGASRSVESVIDEVDALLAENNIHARSAIQLQKVGSFPKTKTNKIKRKDLSKVYIDNRQSKQQGKAANNVKSIYCKIFNLEKVDSDATFNALGGDSLTYVRASVELEKVLGHLPDSWENLPLSELEQQKNTAKKISIFSKIETGIFLRFLAIIAVVSHHAGLSIVKGGATLLMIIAGYNYVRFQWPKLLLGDGVGVVKSLFINVLIPYWLILVGYMALKGYVTHPYDLLLISNSIYPKATGVSFQVWFVQTLMQCIVLFSLPLMFKKIRTWAAENQAVYIGFFAVFLVVLRVLDEMFGFGVAYNLQGGQSSWVAWLFGLGAIVFALRNQAKIVLSIVATVLAFIFFSPDYSRVIFISLGSILLLWLPHIKVPRLSLGLIQAVSAASLFIYMLHGRAPVDSVAAEWSIDIIRIGVGILIGVIVYTLYNFGWTVLAKMKQMILKSRD